MTLRALTAILPVTGYLSTQRLGNPNRRRLAFILSCLYSEARLDWPGLDSTGHDRARQTRVERPLARLGRPIPRLMCRRFSRYPGKSREEPRDPAHGKVKAFPVGRLALVLAKSRGHLNHRTRSNKHP